MVTFLYFTLYVRYMHDLTAFQRDCLRVIARVDDKPHGLLISDELSDEYGIDIHHGRLYPNLDNLVEMGLVEKGEVDGRTNWYKLTSRGKREIAQIVEKWKGAISDY